MLKYCTLTGADDLVDPNALAARSRVRPWIEWAVLYSPTRSSPDSPRYPSQEWIKNFLVVCHRHNTAIHLCGGALNEFLHSKAEILQMVARAKRVQVNFNYQKTPLDLVHLRERFEDHPRTTFIIQENKANTGVANIMRGVKNVELLFDSSGGRGTQRADWPHPIKGFSCGYAGGLGPDNIAGEIERIAGVVKGKEYWIDMESRIRTDDRFDLVKVDTVLDAVAAHLQGRSLHQDADEAASDAEPIDDLFTGSDGS